MNNDLPLLRLFPSTSTYLPQMPDSNKCAEPEPNNLQRSHSFQVASNLLLSFRYAAQGVGYAFRTQRNFRIHLLIGAIALGLSVYLQIPAVSCAVISLTITLVLVLELLNTALEAVVDLTVGREFHQLAKIAKDCAAGAVLIAAIAALIVAVILLLPAILLLVFPSH
ncbi:diacylglycerol kinase family protein [Pseudanabaena biceps]|nr:diacylglycerol kinase family protein [Pseudanabaena biceps]